MYTPKNFKAYELVPREVFESHTEEEVFGMFDQNLLRDMDVIHDICVEQWGDTVYIIVNDWKPGGKFSQRGLRTDPNTGAKLSMHRSGDAFDFDVYYRNSNRTKVKVPANTVRKLITENRRRLIAVRRIESGVSWVHVDSKIHEFIKG